MFTLQKWLNQKAWSGIVDHLPREIMVRKGGLGQFKGSVKGTQNEQENFHFFSRQSCH